jgi:hypothetical protein
MTFRNRKIIGDSGKILLKTNGKEAVLPQYVTTITCNADASFLIPSGDYYLTNLNYSSGATFGDMGLNPTPTAAIDDYVYLMGWNYTGILTQFYINGVGPAYITGGNLTYNHGVMTGTSSYSIGVDGSGTITVTY